MHMLRAVAFSNVWSRKKKVAEHTNIYVEKSRENNNADTKL